MRLIGIAVLGCWLVAMSLCAFNMNSELIKVGDIEFLQKPPDCVKKAMEYNYANKLKDNGLLRFRNIEYYRVIEGERSDKYEGIGLNKLNGHTMTSGTVNQVFVWCCSLKEANSSELLKLDENYNAILTITNPLEFIKRISESIAKMYSILIQCGEITYDRMKSVTKEELNDKVFQHNIFQKGETDLYQNEYRISLTNIDWNNKIENDFIDVLIGDCSDIVTINNCV